MSRYNSCLKKVKSARVSIIKKFKNMCLKNKLLIKKITIFQYVFKLISKIKYSRATVEVFVLTFHNRPEIYIKCKFRISLNYAKNLFLFFISNLSISIASFKVFFCGPHFYLSFVASYLNLNPALEPHFADNRFN